MTGIRGYKPHRLLATAALIAGAIPAAAQPVITPRDAARIDALIAQMTPEEKAAQIEALFALPGPDGRTKVDSLVESGTGAFVFVSTATETNRLQHIAIEHSRLKIPLLFGYDVLHGLTTVFPVPIATAASWDPEMVARDQAIAAREARAVGVRWVMAPMVDIARDPRWGRMVEGAGEDPYLGSAMAAAQVRGFQQSPAGSPQPVIVAVKHFAGYGAAIGGRDYDEASISDADLWNVYLPPFKAAVDAGAQTIMSAYMPLNGIPATGNRWLLTDVLRRDWGFKGWVVSDNMAVKKLQVHGLAAGPEDAAALALHAGLDMELAFGGPAFAQLPKALADHKATTAELDAAVRRVLETKVRLGLFDHPYVDEAQVSKALGSPAHLEAARIAAERSAVLLRNSGGLLPLDRTRLHAVAVIGSLADSPRDALGPWAFTQNAPPEQSILDGIRAKLGTGVTVQYASGVAVPPRLFESLISKMDKPYTRPAPADDATGIADAVKAAQSSDVAVLVLGEAQDMIGEMASTSSLDLPGRQQDLLDAVVATGKPVVVVLMNGRPLDLKDTKATAILDIWYPGSRGGDATANLLFGDVSPAGKLPFTWPRNAAQVPLYYSHLTTHAPAEADKRYWNEPNSPVYPFGFGLAYSTFSYSNLRVDRARIAPGDAVTVTVDLRNTGTRRADEVAQLYIHQRTGTASRPVRELQGFQRVALKPGETRTLTFAIRPDDLRYWNAASRGWVNDDSVFDIAVGGDSTAPFGTSFSVEPR